MLKKITFISSLFATSAYAHVGTENSMQHASEHMLLAALLVPAAWLVFRLLSAKK